MKKGICIILITLFLGSLSSCAANDSETNAPSLLTTGSDSTNVSYEDLVAEIDNLKQQINGMRIRMLDAQGALNQCENYHRTNLWDYELLELAASSNQPVGQFYGIIRAIDRASNPNGFIFTIDQVEINSGSVSPDSGFFNNPDESTEKFNAPQRVIVNGLGYSSFEDKENNLLNKEDDSRLYNVVFVFYTIDDNIVCFIEYGP